MPEILCKVFSSEDPLWRKKDWNSAYGQKCIASQKHTSQQIVQIQFKHSILILTLQFTKSIKVLWKMCKKENEPYTALHSGEVCSGFSHTGIQQLLRWPLECQFRTAADNCSPDPNSERKTNENKRETHAWRAYLEWHSSKLLSK